MTTNQIIILAIVILLSVIVVFGAYFLIVFLMNKKKEKKIDTIFNPTNLVEEESLLNVMDQKKNVEYQKTTAQDQERFVNNQEQVKIVSAQGLSQEQKVNPFGVDLTMHTKEDGFPIEYQDSKNENKFFK